MKSRLVHVALVFVSTTAALGICGFLSYREGRATEPLVRFLDPRLTPSIDEAFVSFPVEYALRSTEKNDVIFLGDSTCHDDIDPSTMALRSYNLSSLGSIGPLGILLTATAYLDHHPKPRVVVLCIYPLRFEVGSGSAGGHVIRRLIANYGPEVDGVVPPQEGIAYFVRRGALTLGGRDEKGRAILDGPLRGMEAETFLTLQNKMSETRGFFALPSEHGGRWTVETPAPKTFILPEWTDGIRRLASLCNRAGVPLVIRFAPIWDGVSKSRDFGLLDEWARGLEAAQPNVTVARPIVLAFERRFMWDAFHLNAAGVEKFMPVVAKDVQTALGK
jgi:hypothetical protein